jgi:hypothetical protein
MEQPAADPSAQSSPIIPVGLEEAGFTVRDTVFLGLSVIALMLGTVIAWRLMRNPVHTAPVDATNGDPQVAR